MLRELENCLFYVWIICRWNSCVVLNGMYFLITNRAQSISIPKIRLQRNHFSDLPYKFCHNVISFLFFRSFLDCSFSLVSTVKSRWQRRKSQIRSTVKRNICLLLNKMLLNINGSTSKTRWNIFLTTVYSLSFFWAYFAIFLLDGIDSKCATKLNQCYVLFMFLSTIDTNYISPCIAYVEQYNVQHEWQFSKSLNRFKKEMHGDLTVTLVIIFNQGYA